MFSFSGFDIKVILFCIRKFPYFSIIWKNNIKLMSIFKYLENFSVTPSGPGNFFFQETVNYKFKFFSGYEICCLVLLFAEKGVLNS